MRLEQKPKTKKTPHHKSKNAKLAEGRGERTWTNWKLKDLVDVVLKVNGRGVSEKSLRSVKSLEYLRVKLLERTERHHVALRMPEPHNDRMAQYYRVDERLAEKLTPQEVAKWRTNKPDDAELDTLVKNMTGKIYYRSHRSD